MTMSGKKRRLQMMSGLSLRNTYFEDYGSEIQDGATLDINSLKEWLCFIKIPPRWESCREKETLLEWRHFEKHPHQSYLVVASNVTQLHQRLSQQVLTFRSTIWLHGFLSEELTWHFQRLLVYHLESCNNPRSYTIISKIDSLVTYHVPLGRIELHVLRVIHWRRSLGFAGIVLGQYNLIERRLWPKMNTVSADKAISMHTLEGYLLEPTLQVHYRPRGQGSWDPLRNHD